MRQPKRADYLLEKDVVELLPRRTAHLLGLVPELDATRLRFALCRLFHPAIPLLPRLAAVLGTPVGRATSRYELQGRANSTVVRAALGAAHPLQDATMPIPSTRTGLLLWMTASTRLRMARRTNSPALTPSMAA